MVIVGLVAANCRENREGTCLAGTYVLEVNNGWIIFGEMPFWKR